MAIRITPRRARLATGLVMFSFLVTHFGNHALGLVSLDAMEAGRLWFLALWRNPVGRTLLYGALLVHFGLALWAIYRRRRLMRIPLPEAAPARLRPRDHSRARRARRAHLRRRGALWQRRRLQDQCSGS